MDTTGSVPVGSTQGRAAARLDLGFFLPTLTDVPRGTTLGWKDHLAMVRAAEAAGFDSIWIADETLFTFDDAPPMGWWECWTTLSAVAAATARARVGTLVTCTNYRNPALIARMAATVDEISGGRLVLGLGAGYSERQFRAFGFPTDHLVGRFEESLSIIHGLLRDGHVTMEGRFQRAEHAVLFPPGPRPGAIPIMAGGTGPSIMRLAATYADAWNLWLMGGECSVERAAQFLGALDRACSEVGRDPATLKRSAAIMVALTDEPVFVGSRDWAAGALHGTPVALAEQLRRFQARGFDEVQVCVAPATVGAVEDFGHVVALVREATGAATVRQNRAGVG